MKKQLGKCRRKCHFTQALKDIFVQDSLVTLDWAEVWHLLCSLVPQPRSELWATLDDCRIMPLADGTMHRMKERTRILVLPQGALYDQGPGEGT